MRTDDYDFEATAKAVFEMNDSCKIRYDSWEDLQSFMISMAYTHMHKSNSFSTGGFCLTAYDDHEGERAVRASVSSYVANQYIAKIHRIKELIKVL